MSVPEPRAGASAAGRCGAAGAGRARGRGARCPPLAPREPLRPAGRAVPEPAPPAPRPRPSRAAASVSSGCESGRGFLGRAGLREVTAGAGPRVAAVRNLGEKFGLCRRGARVGLALGPWGCARARVCVWGGEVSAKSSFECRQHRAPRGGPPGRRALTFYSVYAQGWCGVAWCGARWGVTKVRLSTCVGVTGAEVLSPRVTPCAEVCGSGYPSHRVSVRG